MSVDHPNQRGGSGFNSRVLPRVRGRPFQKGNGGRKPGSKNKTTLVAEALLEGEEAALVRKGIELAKAGDTAMLKFFLERILPKERPIQIDLPAMNSVSDAIDGLAALIKAASTGEITPTQAAGMASAITTYARMTDFAEAEQRLEKIEKQLETFSQ
jgi:hypothetical protein